MQIYLHKYLPIKQNNLQKIIIFCWHLENTDEKLNPYSSVQFQGKYRWPSQNVTDPGPEPW